MIVPPNGGFLGHGIPYASAAGGPTAAEFSALEGRVEANEVETALVTNTKRIIRYLPAEGPAGYATAIEALYQFDGTANDLTDRAKSYDLTIANGTQYHTYLGQSQLTSWAAGENTWARTAIDANLACLAACTIEATFMWRQDSSDTDHIVAIIGDPTVDTEAENASLVIFFLANSGQIRIFSEHGAGVNDLKDWLWVPPRDTIVYLAVVRAADGVTVEIFIDGYSLGQQVMDNAPTGGANSRLYVGGYDTGSDFYGDIYSVRYSKGAMTAGQIELVNTALRV